MTNPITRAAQTHNVMAVLEGRKIISKPKPTKEDKPKRVPVAKRKKLDPDYWFSLCVRERAGWTCDACHKHYEPSINLDTGLPGSRSIDCSHYIGRANYSVRFDPLNADAHCCGCHRRFEGNPHMFKEWKSQQLGEDTYNILIEKSNNIMLGKQARREKQEIAEHYKAEFERIHNGQDKEFIGYL